MNEDDIWWIDESGIGIDVWTGMFVVRGEDENDNPTLVEWWPGPLTDDVTSPAAGRRASCS